MLESIPRIDYGNYSGTYCNISMIRFNNSVMFFIGSVIHVPIMTLSYFL